MQVDDEENLVGFKVRRALVTPQVAELRQNERIDRELRESDYKARDDVNGQRSFPAAFFERKSLAEPQNQRRYQKPDVAGKKLPRENPPERNRVVGTKILKSDLTGEKNSAQRPD